MNETTETKTPTGAGAATGAAAPAAPVTQEPAKIATAEPSASAEKQPSGESPDAKERARLAFQSRDQRREKKASEELAEARKEIERLKASQPQPKPESEPEPSFLDDPDKWAANLRQKATQDAVESIKREQAQAKADYEYRQATGEAAQFLLTRSHLKEDVALREQVLKIVEDKYADVAERNPKAAARLAYIDACAEKGISPDMDGFKSPGFNATGGAASSGVSHSAPAGGKRVFAKGEAKKYLDEVDPAKDPAELKRRNQEVKEAYAEGRVQR